MLCPVLPPPGAEIVIIFQHFYVEIWMTKAVIIRRVFMNRKKKNLHHMQFILLNVSVIRGIAVCCLFTSAPGS